ncbi:MAG TPA: M28 family peptidase [Solirubrobacteraceae bacterium]|jgi:hypothetical protein|nr:M28 family peptidase [Solirubrobacteraceae bacterium]
MSSRLSITAPALVAVALAVWGVWGFPLPAAIAGGPDKPAATRSAGAAQAATTTTAGSDAIPAATTDHFDAYNAFRLLRAEVLTYGWRPAGSASLRKLAVRLRGLLPNGHFESIPGHPKLRDVVGSIPGTGKAIVLGAHYDVESHPPGFVGANDGAAGTAAVVWLARALAKLPPKAGAPPIEFVLFDGEEEPPNCLQDVDFIHCALRGSKAYAKRHAAQTQAMVLLDYIAQKVHLSFPREGASDPTLWQKLRAAAAAVGVGSIFPNLDAPFSIIDDHTFFTRRGVPSIDVIDFDYPPRDGLRDTLDKVSEASLDAVGEATYQLMTTLRDGG